MCWCGTRCGQIQDNIPVEDEDGENATKTANNELEAAPEVELRNEADHEYGDGSSGNQVADEEDLQNRRCLECQNNRGDDDQNNEQTDEPDVETVAEQVVGCRRDHGGLQAVKRGCAQAHHHD